MKNDALRQTGRTTRMLEAALEAAKAGEHVVVVGSSYADARSFLQRCWVLYPPAIPRSVSHELLVDGGSIRFRISDNQQWNWETMKFHGTDRYARVFIDHAAIEVAFDQILTEMHRWDKETE